MSATAAQSCGAPAVYHRRQPERTLLYRVVLTQLATWLALHEIQTGEMTMYMKPIREFKDFVSDMTCAISKRKLKYKIIVDRWNDRGHHGLKSGAGGALAKFEAH